MTTKKEQAIHSLDLILKPGDTVYTKLLHVSRSGMSRVLDLYVIRDNKPHRITWDVAEATGCGYSRKYEGATVGGCGFDAGFHLVYALGRVLFQEFRCIGEGCPSNDHCNYRRMVQCHGTSGDDGVPCFKDEKGVYRLRAGVGEEFALGEVCPVCKGKGQWPNPQPAPKKGDKHSDPGYALNHKWL